jgi:hypothetical protein
VLLGAVASTLMLALACGSFATEARADGDPASDVLATQPLFLPQDAGIPFAQQGQVTGLVEAADRSGYPIRVAIIASSTDLGSVTELWHQPQTYARFLGQELSLVYRGPLLVVMPGGYGISAGGLPDPAGASSLAGLRTPTGGAALGAAALTAIERLAEASGHSLAVPAATATTSAGGTDGAIPLFVFALGAVLIAVAWTASLRARPPQVGRRKASSST